MVNALRRLLPSENIFYLGDNARIPYGNKGAATVTRYSFELSGLLLAEEAKAIVVACNTATALAVPRMQETLRVPVVGVIAPGAAAAVAATRSGRVGVIGTHATISSGAYERALRKLDPALNVTAMACPLFVPLIEEGLLDDPLTDQHIARYLRPLLDAGIDTLILGCTHYPLLHDAIARQAGPAIRLVDSAQNCALAVRELAGGRRPRRAGRPDGHAASRADGFQRPVPAGGGAGAWACGSATCSCAGCRASRLRRPGERLLERRAWAKCSPRSTSV